MDYLNFVIEHSPKKQLKDQKLTIFEKVMLASKRAHDLAREAKPTDDELVLHKYTTAGLYEVLHNKVEAVEHVPKYEDIDEEEFDEEEEDDIDPSHNAANI